MPIADEIAYARDRIEAAEDAVLEAVGTLPVELPETLESVLLLDTVASQLECDAAVLDRIINGWK